MPPAFRTRFYGTVGTPRTIPPRSVARSRAASSWEARGKFSCATRADYAEVAVTALAGTGHDGKTYELAGDHAYTLSDFAAEISRQTGRTIPYRNLPVPEYATALVGFGVPEAMARAVASWDAEAADGALFDNGRQLSALIGRPTTPLSTTVAEALAAVSKA
jgi:NAD(P)H dehydrogenase (quinone)